MKTDTERLNWLEQNKKSIYQVFKLRSKVDVGYPVAKVNCYEEFIGWAVTDCELTFKTVRAAIDNAMNTFEN